MKGLATIALVLIATTASAEEFQTLYDPSGKNDKSKWILADGKFVTYELELAEGPTADYEVKNGKVVRETICKDSTDWEKCTRILLVSFSSECIMQKIMTYCDQYKEIKQLVELAAMAKSQ